MQINNKWLFSGGVCSLLASILHIAIIFGGANWYRFFGAGEGMARMAERGSQHPANMTFLIASVLAVWAVYAFSGAGIVRRLPLLYPILGVISAIYLLRSVLLIPLTFLIDDIYLNELNGKMTFLVITSIVSLVIGLLYTVGTLQCWKNRKSQSVIS